MMATTIDAPLVSIITATYNRSNVLVYTIASVLRSTLQDWELLVIGDACTDDTEQVVASFRDQRIRFVNLIQNVGEQSGPNNAGFGYARGRYIAYLNHDDLWLPDHLTTVVRGIEETGADLVFTLADIVMRDGSNVLSGISPTGRYEPYISVPASSWLLRREMVSEIGPWRFYRECYNVPSADWLFRAWKAKKDMRLIPHMTVVAIQSGARKDVYATREFEENRRYFDRIASELDFRERELARIALYYGREKYRGLQVSWHLQRALKNLVIRSCLALSIHPASLMYFLRYHRRGGFIDHLRQYRGLDRPQQNRRV